MHFQPSLWFEPLFPPNHSLILDQLVQAVVSILSFLYRYFFWWVSDVFVDVQASFSYYG